MSAPVTVTQADRTDAERFNCDLRCGMTGTQVANLAGLFAKRRLASEAALRAREAELVEALRWYADTFCEGFGECVGDTCGKWPDDQCSGCKAFAILARAKATSDAEGV